MSAEGTPPLLRRNVLNIRSPQPLPIDVKASLQSELSSFYRQKLNERSLLAFGTPVRLWWYFRYKDKDSRFARWVLKRIAEPPTFFDEDLSRRTAENFRNYLRQRGYLEARTYYETRYKEHVRRKKSASPQRWREASVSYFVDLGRQYTVASVSFSSPDTQIHRILQETAGGSLLKREAPLDKNLFEAEKNRIAYILKNRGYALFQPSSIEFVGDSSGTKTHITATVDVPTDSASNRIYRIGNVAVFVEFVPELVGMGRDTTLEGIYFTTSSSQFAVRPERLLSVIAFRPDSLYRQEDFDRTVRDLNTLGVFQFVTVRPQPDSIALGRIHITISMSLNERLSIGTGVDLNSSNSNDNFSGNNLLGASAYLSVDHRNLLLGAENLRSDLSYGIELNLPSLTSIFSQEFRFQNELLFPRYFDYFNLWSRLNRWHLVPDRFHERLRRDGRVRMALNYSLLDLRNLYTNNLLSAAWGYSFRLGNEHHLVFDHVGIDILSSQARGGFASIVANNELLRRSLEPQLFTGFLLRSLTYTYLGRPNVFGERWFFRWHTDLSGIEAHLLNQLWALRFGQQEWSIGGLQFSKYLRLELSGSYTRAFTKDLAGVLHLRSGLALPFGGARTVPYVKQFFVGGPSSLRAWRIRELGPGGYIPPDTLRPPFFQAGDVRLEFNGELRFPIFWWMKGAVFVDGGNIWTLLPDAQRPNSALRWDFFQNIAIGTGFGVRLDFNYFVFRFDWGIKVRNPYRNPENGNYWIDWRRYRWRDISNFNIAIGYPF